MQILKSLAVSALFLGSGALSATIVPPPPPLETRAAPASAFKEAAAVAPEPTTSPSSSFSTADEEDDDPCAPDPFCDPAWPVGSVSVVTDAAAGVCTPVLSTRFYSHVCGRTTWTTSTTITSTADCGACAIGTLAPLEYKYYVPRCPLGGHYTVSTAVVPSTRTMWDCAATATS